MSAARRMLPAVPALGTVAVVACAQSLGTIA